MDTGDSGRAEPALAQQTLAALWAEVLQLGHLPSSTDNFFELGGDSMTLTLLEFRINEELGVSIPGHAIMNCSSLADLTNLIESSPAAKSH